ncbi:MAG: Asp-tRNA(Asn)/Glu-tRNA(Gln) amidotransferase subunit GatB [Flavobacteriales bacterium]|nr:Asp-tRNA(Asn)/Glu-tRNA(Gln) amidotransferase subunit GatB [Flavobacteriales bacterium]
MNTEYEVVIGLEIHAQLLTKSKAFSSDRAEYGEHPNTLLSPVSLGHPGTLPFHNEEAVEKSIKVGLAFGSEIERFNKYSRKNYFYADLPKGYQITQFDTPICKGGKVNIKLSDGTRKSIGLTRAHMEEDTGKSIHDQDAESSLIDYNRAGTPLIEIVTEPEIRSGEEAYQFLSEVRKVLRYLDVCDGNMEEGSFRCDCNISVRPKGSEKFGTKVEVKNMNSMSNVKRAIEFEAERQIELVKKGIVFNSETRSFDALNNRTISMRSKEMVNDYRYFPEPDLPPLVVTDEMIRKIAEDMPALPEEMFLKFTNEYGLSEYDAGVLTETKALALFYEEVCKINNNFKSVANWVMVHLKAYMNEKALDFEEISLNAKTLSDLIKIIDDGKISHSAAQKVFTELLERGASDPLLVAGELNLLQTGDSDLISEFIEAAILKYPDKVEAYKSGKTGLLGLFMGEVMKLSGGKADPKSASEMLRQRLES